MIPQAYFDLEMRRVDDESPAPVLLSAAWRQVHQAAGALHLPFAAAFPEIGAGPTLGRTLRVFCESLDACGSLIDACGTRLDDIAVVRRPKAVPGDIPHYEAYMMRRLTGRKHKPALHGMGALRVRQLAQQAALPFAWMVSSKGLRFKLVVERIVPVIPTMDAAPNGYGLSRQSAVVALPVF